MRTDVLPFPVSMTQLFILPDGPIVVKVLDWRHCKFGLASSSQPASWDYWYREKWTEEYEQYFELLKDIYLINK